MDQRRAIIIGISGCSSSGKTTLARLLRDIFPETFVLHEDDFYKPESELPIKDGLVDWDCPEAISIPDLEAALEHIRATGTFPVSTSMPTRRLSHRSNHGCVSIPSLPLSFPLSPTLSPPPLPLFPLPSLPSTRPKPPTTSSLTTTANPDDQQQPTVDSKEDQNSVGPCPATAEQIAACAARVREWLSPGCPGSLIFPSSSHSSSVPPTSNPNPPRICILDGFLLYSPPAFSRVMSLLDVKLFLRVSKTRAVRRREQRDGYVTLEGFWKDPPGYVEKIVWPDHVEAHSWLFEGGQVEGGRMDAGVLRREGIEVLDGSEHGEDVEFGRVLEWAVEALIRALERIVLGREDGGREVGVYGL